MDDSYLIFPRCGLTVGDVKEAAVKAKSNRHGADMLGVNPAYMHVVCKRHGLLHLFDNKKRRKRKVSKDQIVELANQGYIRCDVATMLDISTGYLNCLIWKWGLSAEFVNSGGKARKIKKEGYCV
jgi:hypothetical protein